jgi:hypothetical protein
MWGAFNGLLAILAPGVIIRRNISKLVADCWHPDCPPHSQFSVCKAKKNSLSIARTAAATAKLATNIDFPHFLSVEQE